MRDFVYLVAGVVVALLVGALALVSVLDLALWVAGVLFLVVAIFLFFWDFEKDAVFKDDWIEIAQVTASLVVGIAGLALLLVHFVS